MDLITSKSAKQLFSEMKEVAFIDVRENAQYGSGHPFFVSHVAYSILELKIRALVPCFKTRIILIDDNDGVANQAAIRLEELGYQSVAVIDGGIPAWRAAGYALYEGISAPSKAFGEIVEHQLGTPSITASVLANWRNEEKDFILLDGRTTQEFNKMTIPGSTSCPNGELGLRYPAMVPNDEIDIVINCAGRTRSLVGAQTLRTLGVPNKVYALENGTMGWKLAGFELEYGATRKYPDILSDDLLQKAKNTASKLIRQYSIPVIEYSELENWQNDNDRTTYVFDVRTAEEFKTGHIDRAVNAPGGQLVQATDHWIATRNARIVIYDNNRIRAVTTAIWLKGMGHDAYVVNEDTAPLISLRSARERFSTAEIISLKEIVNLDVTIIDVRSSQEYRDGHLKNAAWGIRPRVNKLEIKNNTVAIIASDVNIADLVAKEFPNHKIYISLCRPDEWRQAGLDLVSTPDFPVDEDRIDFLFHTHDRHSGNMESAREYLRWETGLIDQMDEQEKSTLQPLKP